MRIMRIPCESDAGSPGMCRSEGHTVVARRPMRSGLAAVAVLALGSLTPQPVTSQSVDPLAPSASTRLPTRELVRIGGYDERPAHTFSAISGAAVLSPGEVAVADRGSGEIRVFDLEGAFLRRFGREGSGPGEFKFLTAIEAHPPDRIVGWDFEARRVVTFGIDGTHVSTHALQPNDMGSLWAEFVGTFPDGSFVLRHDPVVLALRSAADGFRSEATAFIRYSPTAGPMDTIAVLQGPEKYLYHEDGTWDLEDRLFERSVDGVISAGVLWVGMTESLGLQGFTPEGEQLDRVTLGRPARPVRPEDRDFERTRRIEEFEARQERMAELMGGMMGATSSAGRIGLERLQKVGSYETLPDYRSITGTGTGTGTTGSGTGISGSRITSRP